MINYKLAELRWFTRSSFSCDKIEQIILNNPTEKAIYESARKKGMLTLKEAAIVKGFNKEVPFSEINLL